MVHQDLGYLLEQCDNMRNLKSISRIILYSLSKSAKGLSAYSLFQRSGVSFSVFSSTLSYLLSEELIVERSDDFFTITDRGLSVIVVYQKEKVHQGWKKVPERILCAKLDSKFYVPSKRLFKRKPSQEQINNVE